jgi:hypothetical protein
MGGMPLLMQYVQALMHPNQGGVDTNTGQPTRPVSRGDATLEFLGNFLSNMSAGLAQSGHGPGANLRGAGAAMQAPYQRALQGYQLGQQQQLQQAQIQQEQARTQAQVQAYTQQPRFDPETRQYLGTMTDQQYSQFIAGKYRGAAAAETGAQAKVDVANIAAKSKLDVAKVGDLIRSGQAWKILTAQDDNGNPVMRVYNKQGQPLGDLPGALPPASYLPKSTSTIEYKQMDDGTIQSLPKGTTSQAVLPGKGGAAAPKGGSAPVAVKDAQGNPLIGKGAVTGTTRTMVETAPKVLDLVDRIKGQINDLDKSGALGPGMSRWNEFWSGKVGTDNPQFRALMTNTTLLSTLLMRMHMGARGGQQIMQHFDQMIGAGHQSAANLRSSLDQIELYANDVKGATPLPANYGTANTGTKPKQSLDSFWKK